MGLRGKLEEIKSEKVTQEQASEQEKLLSEQERTRQEEENFLAAHTRKNTLAEASRSLQGARKETRSALLERKAEFRNITGLMDEIKAEDPTQELPSFKEVIADPEQGSDEEKYTQSKEEVFTAIAELRQQKEVLKELGVDADGLSDAELVDAVQKAQENAGVDIREYLIQHPNSDLPEAVQERGERVAAVEKKLKSIQAEMESHTEWGQKHIGPHISSWNDNPENLVAQIREDITSFQRQVDEERSRLAQIDRYKDFLEGTGVMKDPEVVRTYEPAVKANAELKNLKDELFAIQQKGTSRVFGYTEKKKQEDISGKQNEIAAKEIEAKRNSEAYHAAGDAYNERYEKFKDIFRTGQGKTGGYKEMKDKLEKSIQEISNRITTRREELSNATYYAERRRALMNEEDAQSQELTALKGERLP